MSFQLQILATVTAKLFQRLGLPLSEDIPVHHVCSEATEKVAKEVDLFDVLHGSEDTVHTCSYCCVQHTQSHFVQNLVSWKTTQRKEGNTEWCRIIFFQTTILNFYQYLKKKKKKHYCEAKVIKQTQI